MCIIYSLRKNLFGVEILFLGQDSGNQKRT